MPKVGQRGSVSKRSNTPIGKFDSIPPSTSHACPPVIWSGQRAGRKKYGMADDARTASATEASCGSTPNRARYSHGRLTNRPWDRSETIATNRKRRSGSSCSSGAAPSSFRGRSAKVLTSASWRHSATQDRRRSPLHQPLYATTETNTPIGPNRASGGGSRNWRRLTDCIISRSRSPRIPAATRLPTRDPADVPATRRNR